MNPGKLLHVVPSLAPETGGPARSVPRLVEVLRQRGWDVLLATTDFMGAPGQDVRIPLQVFRHEPAFWTGSSARSPRLLRWLSQSAGSFAGVHVHSLWNPVATYVLRELRLAGVPYAISPRGMLDPVSLKKSGWKKRPWAWLWERANVEQASFIHFTTAAECEKALKTGWRFQESVIAPNLLPVFPNSRDKIEPPSIRKLVLYAGRVSWKKNLELLLRSFSRVCQRRSDVDLVVAGPDQEGLTPRLESLAARYGISDRVSFSGHLAASSLQKAYRCAEVVVLVSRQENFGMTLAESLILGTPVVAGDEVDLASDWPGHDSPAIRVATNESDIARGLLEQLERSARIGRPDPAAVEMAKRWTDPNQLMPLESAYLRYMRNRPA